MSEKIMEAFIFGTGRIGVAEKAPELAIFLTRAPATLLAQTLDSIAQHNDDGSFMYVDSVYRSRGAIAAIDAIFDFRDLLNSRLSRALASQTGGRHVSAAPRI